MEHLSSLAQSEPCLVPGWDAALLAAMQEMHKAANRSFTLATSKALLNIPGLRAAMIIHSNFKPRLPCTGSIELSCPAALCVILPVQPRYMQRLRAHTAFTARDSQRVLQTQALQTSSKSSDLMPLPQPSRAALLGINGSCPLEGFGQCRPSQSQAKRSPGAHEKQQTKGK